VHTLLQCGRLARIGMADSKALYAFDFLERCMTSAVSLPVVFVSHGAPSFALDAGTSGPALHTWAQALRQRFDLRAVVIMSPHWQARTPTVMATAKPKTLHDFGGFAPAFYALEYPAEGSPAVANEVLTLLGRAGIAAAPDDTRPLDHGAWVPLMHLFPKADVPVVQVALPHGYGPTEVFALGAALRSLRDNGVLVIGSGSMTHNLGEFAGDGAPTAPYVDAFSRWVETALVRGDMQALLAYRVAAPHAQRAHPTEDHFLPLFFALGAGGVAARPTYISREVMHGMLAMDSFALE
jgi:4,5-DOPA dioxygenase extradiol